MSTPARATAGAAANASGDHCSQLLAGARVVLQPIVALSTGTVIAVEALTRFTPDGDAGAASPETVAEAGPDSDTAEVLHDAWVGGYGVALELACARAALAARATVPAGAQLFVNLSPDALHTAAGSPHLPADLTGVVVEVTEHAAADPAALAADLVELRSRGARVAVDDVGTGYAGLLRLARMRPDFVKVDREIVAGLGDNAAQAAVLEALVTLSHRLGAAVIAEGVEHLRDLPWLAQYDVDLVQGYAIARPDTALAPLAPDVVEACLAARRSLLRDSAVFASAAARTRDLYTLTAALAAAGTTADVSAVLAGSACELGIDRISLSTLDDADTLREIAQVGGNLDSRPFRLQDYPATLEVLRTGNALEVDVDDPSADPAERAVMRRLGWASMLMVPLGVGNSAFGILELAHSSGRHWSAEDIAHARGLAEHVAAVLIRLSGAPPR